MSEVLEVVSRLTMLFGLFYFAIIDYKTKWIPVVPIVGLGILGFVLNFMSGQLGGEQLLGMLVGAVLLLISVLTAESVGLGDALLFMCTGLFLGFWQNLTLLVGTLFLAGIFSLGCLLLKRKGRHDRVAMGPFILVAYVVFVL